MAGHRLQTILRLALALRAAQVRSQDRGRAEEAVEPLLFGLRMMGYLAGDRGGYRLGNWFFERWLRRVEASRANEARP